MSWFHLFGVSLRWLVHKLGLFGWFGRCRDARYPESWAVVEVSFRRFGVGWPGPIEIVVSMASIFGIAVCREFVVTPAGRRFKKSGFSGHFTEKTTRKSSFRRKRLSTPVLGP